MLVSAKEMLEKAKAGKYAVGQFNINNLEWTKAVLLTAQELQSPVILGVSEGAGKYMTGFETVAAMVKAMHDSLGITVPVALHLDHGTYDSKRTLLSQQSLLMLLISLVFLSSVKLVQSVVKKTVLLVWASAQIQKSVRSSLILA